MHTSKMADSIIQTQALLGAPEDYIGYGQDEPGYSNKEKAFPHFNDKDGKKYRLVAVEKPELGLSYCKRVPIQENQKQLKKTK